MTSSGETYEKLMKFIRFFVNPAPGKQLVQWVVCSKHLTLKRLAGVNSANSPAASISICGI